MKKTKYSVWAGMSILSIQLFSSLAFAEGQRDSIQAAIQSGADLNQPKIVSELCKLQDATLLRSALAHGLDAKKSNLLWIDVDGSKQYLTIVDTDVTFQHGLAQETNLSTYFGGYAEDPEFTDVMMDAIGKVDDANVNALIRDEMPDTCKTRPLFRFPKLFTRLLKGRDLNRLKDPSGASLAQLVLEQGLTYKTYGDAKSAFNPFTCAIPESALVSEVQALVGEGARDFSSLKLSVKENDKGHDEAGIYHRVMAQVNFSKE